MTLEQFQKDYTQHLINEAQVLKAQQIAFKMESREDESKFAQIEGNVVDIFSKMFVISTQKAKASDDWKLSLSEAYLAFFQKIPAPWAERLTQCELHQLDEEAHIERIKLEKAAALRQVFDDLMANA